VATFGLVHGAYHGGWCWSELVPRLTSLGHSAVAVDLPTEDPEAGAQRYAETVVQALDGRHNDDDIVLVGHSLAGLTIPVVATLRPVQHLVYLCALVPRPGASFNQVQAEAPMFSHYTPAVAAVGHSDGSASCPEERALDLFYHDCEPDLARWAARQLRRQHWRVLRETTPLSAIPDVASSYFVCDADRAIDPTWSRAAARQALGVEPVELTGGHSPFLTQPAKLAELLSSLVAAK
jgi:pimeloyl-ACP methyl ester carboxylesterase